ncbi:carbohydrate binding domain-containing protein, partial [candidate division KSB1 bacterium]|nr:carbohydrate binding domain-containing protein [candidate division KSB1 bacterium]
MMRLMATTFIVLLLAALSATLYGEIAIKITNPEDASTIVPCTDLTITAEVTATGGEVIQYVYLYNHGRTLRRLRAAPWEYEWKTIKKGVYELTAMAETADGTQVWSDAVRFKVGSVSNGELLYSGGFDCGVLTPWTGQLNEGAVAIFSVYDDGYFDDPYYLYVEIENGGTDTWHIQLNQQCPTDSGHVYTISFLADSENPKSIVVGMQESQDPWASQLWQTV